MHLALIHICQLDDYYDKFYIKEAKRFKMLAADGCAKAKEIEMCIRDRGEAYKPFTVVKK